MRWHGGIKCHPCIVERQVFATPGKMLLQSILLFFFFAAKEISPEILIRLLLDPVSVQVLESYVIM